MCAFFHNPRIVQSGLVLLLDAANAKSYPGTGTNWADLAGNNYDATLEAGVTFQNNNLLFDAETEYADLDNPFDTDNDMRTTPFTFETAIYPTTTGIWQMLARVRVLTNSNFGLKFALNTQSRIGICFHAQSTSTGRLSFITDDALPLNQWTYVTATYDGSGTPSASNVKVYQNGIKVGNAASLYTLTYMNDADSIRIAGRSKSDQATWFFNGNMSFFNIYNRDLSADEVLQNFNVRKGRYL